MAGGVAAHAESSVVADGSQRHQPVQPVRTIVEACDVDQAVGAPTTIEGVLAGDRRSLARTITAVEGGTLGSGLLDELQDAARQRRAPVLGATGTGGSGKSSLTDELVRRFRLDFGDELRQRGLPGGQGGTLTPVDAEVSTGVTTVVPPARVRHIAEVTELLQSEESGVAPSPAAEPVTALLQMAEEALDGCDPVGDITQALVEVGGRSRCNV